MKIPEKFSQPRTRLISTEAIIGIGTTVAALGLLCTLLGWAELMRSVPAVAGIWIALGVVMLVLGAITTGFAWSKRERR